MTTISTMSDSARFVSAVERAAAVYQQEPCARTFREDLEAHLLHGMVWSTPTAFIMARRVCRDWPPEVIVNPWLPDGETELKWNPELCNCAHIYLAAGDIAQFFNLPHQGIEWVSFERQNRLRFHKLSRIKRLCSTIPTFSARISIPG